MRMMQSPNASGSAEAKLVVADGGSAAPLYTSFDGATWPNTTFGVSNKQFWLLARSPDGKWLASNNVDASQVFTSNDGKTWAFRSTGIGSSYYMVCMAAAPGGKFMAGLSYTGPVSAGLVFSSDGGVTWSSTSGYPSGATRCTAIAYGGNDAGQSFWLMGDDGGRLFRSFDDGATWSASSLVDIGPAVTALKYGDTPAGFWIGGTTGTGIRKGPASASGTWTTPTISLSVGTTAIAYSPTLNLWILVAGTQVFVTTGGDTWTSIRATANPTVAPLRGATWVPSMGAFVLVGDGPVIRTSTDGFAWSSITAPGGATNLIAVCGS